MVVEFEQVKARGGRPRVTYSTALKIQVLLKRKRNNLSIVAKELGMNRGSLIRIRDKLENAQTDAKRYKEHLLYRLASRIRPMNLNGDDPEIVFANLFFNNPKLATPFWFSDKVALSYSDYSLIQAS